MRIAKILILGLRKSQRCFYKQKIENTFISGERGSVKEKIREIYASHPHKTVFEHNSAIKINRTVKTKVM